MTDRLYIQETASRDEAASKDRLPSSDMNESRPRPSADPVSKERLPRLNNRKPLPQVAGASGIGKLSTTTMLLGVVTGLLEWFLSFALGWIPGVSWVISFGFTAVQTIIVYLDPNSQHLPFYERSKLFLKREGILLAAGALSGIPIIGEVIPFEAIAAFLLRLLKVPTKTTDVAK